MFDVEISMHQKVLPALKKLGDEVTMNLNVPKVFFANSDAGVIIMEDLKIQNFHMKQMGVCKKNNLESINIIFYFEFEFVLPNSFSRYFSYNINKKYIN